MEKTFRLLTILSSALALVIIVSNSTAAKDDYFEPWTTVGSTGTVDEADLLYVLFGSPLSGDVRIRDAVRSGTVNIRYNIVAVDGLLMQHAGYTLKARFRDRGDDEQVILKLMKYNLTSGISSTVLTLDSNNFAPAAGYQVQTVDSFATLGCLPEDGKAFDFFENAYFVDATIKKTAANGNPVLSIIQVGTFACLPPFPQD